MQVELHKSFVKNFDKAPDKIQDTFVSRVSIFRENPLHPFLKNHALTGKYKDCRSINITGDIRAIYKQIDENTAVFIALGSHSELYS